MSTYERNHPKDRIPLGQLTERFAPFTPEQPASVQQTVVIEPVRLAPVQQTVVIEPVRQAPVRHSAFIEPNTTEPAPNQDTVSVQPFWLGESEHAPVIRAGTPPINRIETAFAAPFQVTPQASPPPVQAAGVAKGPDKPEALETVCFEPIRVPEQLLHSKLVGRAPLGAQVSAAKEVPSPGKSKSGAARRQPTLLEKLGQLGKQKPAVVWVGGAAVAFAVSAAASFGFAHRRHTDRNRQGAPSLSTRVAGATTHTQTSALSKATANSASMSGPIPPLEISSAPSPATPTLPMKRGQISDPALNAAVGHLIAGRYGDAQKTYLELVSRPPPNPAFAVISKLLVARLSSNCTSNKLTVSCPEVKP